MLWCKNAYRWNMYWFLTQSHSRLENLFFQYIHWGVNVVVFFVYVLKFSHKACKDSIQCALYWFLALVLLLLSATRDYLLLSSEKCMVVSSSCRAWLTSWICLIVSLNLFWGVLILLLFKCVPIGPIPNEKFQYT